MDEIELTPEETAARARIRAASKAQFQEARQFLHGHNILISKRSGNRYRVDIGRMSYDVSPDRQKIYRPQLQCGSRLPHIEMPAGVEWSLLDFCRYVVTVPGVVYAVNEAMKNDQYRSFVEATRREQ